MVRNQLPEGVGKKIVEALKRQAEADIAPLEEESSAIGNNIPLTELNEISEINIDNSAAGDLLNEKIVEEEDELKEETLVSDDNSIMNEKVIHKVDELPPELSKVNNIESIKQTYFTDLPINQEKAEEPVLKFESNIKMPSNVATLRKLIMGLPAGVTKQTGAQIIKQTFDAMGVPMNNVLKEAQSFQEELNGSTREYMIKIQEYKTQIMQLEKSVSDYQQSIAQVNDLISLFLGTEK